MSITHEQLRKIACAYLRKHKYVSGHRYEGFGCSTVFSEIVTAAGDIPDAVGWAYGSSVMIECKVSRSDFKADQLKPQRLAGSGMGDKRYFLTPAALVKPEELPHEWGLLETDGKKVTRAYEPDWRERSIDHAGHVAEKRLMLSVIRRIQMREFLIISPEQMEDVLDAR